MIKREFARSGTLAALLVFSAGVSMAQQIPDEIAQLKAQVQQLQQQLQMLSKKLDEVTTAKSADSAPATTAAANNADAITPNPATQPVRPLIASTTPMVAPEPVTRPSVSPIKSPVAGPAPYYQAPESPLQIKIGDAYITPIGFMDFTGVVRSKNNSGNIGTNFGSIPYGSIYQTNLSEFRLSMQNSRIGFRADAMISGYHVIGYMEADFLGYLPPNVLVSSNSNTLRSRLYWVDISKHGWELLGGQTWSLITPGRSGISPLPGDLFYSNNIDVNYQAGLVWGRIPELRLVYHTSDQKAHFALAIDNPEQYVGGSAGGAVPTFPAALTTYPGGQLNNGTTTTSVPNVAPDVIAKLAFDPLGIPSGGASKAHFEIVGLERNFKVWNPNNQTHYSATGAGVAVNMNFEIAKGFRLITNNFWSDGGGRYIFGQAPDLIARADGSLSTVHSGSTVSGFEYTTPSKDHPTLFYAYYGGIYIGKNLALDANGHTLVGYGLPATPAQNRAIQEVTFGLTQTIWNQKKWGRVQYMFQYSYLQRNPWSIAVGAPSNANLNMVFMNLRYELPGNTPHSFN